MFVKPLVKYNKSTKQRYNIYQLCESFRLDGRIRHRVIIGLGKLDELAGEDKKKLLGKRIEELVLSQGNRLPFCQEHETVEKLAYYYFGEGSPDWQTVDLSTLQNKDARLIVLAVVINPEGFLKYSNIFEGNMTDSKTLETIVNALSKQTSFSDRKPIVVIDAGIATDGNLKMLKNKGYGYMCVSRSNLKEYRADSDSTPVEIKDKRNQPIELMKVKVGKDDDKYLWVKSKAKALKENSMNGLLSQRFEEGVQSINEGINKKGGTKKLDKVFERIGRLKQKYPSVHRYYTITIEDDGKGTATAISCKHKQGEDTNKKAGIYFLRTTLDENDEQTLWSIYNIIREIEYTFRVLKTDLDLRPVYHKTDGAAMAHLHLGILAYWLVATIRFQLKQKGYRHDWSEIVRIMNTQKCVTTNVENNRGQIISVRQCTEPTQKAKYIYNLMDYKTAPFYRKKSVVVPAENFKNDTS